MSALLIHRCGIQPARHDARERRRSQERRTPPIPSNARLSLKGRELLIERVENAGWSLIAAAEAAGVSDRTARKWIARHRAEGHDGLLDRSSAPLVVC